MCERDYSPSRPDLAAYPEPPFGSGVNTGGVNLSAAGGVDSLSKNLSGTGVGTWDANPLPRLSTQKVTLV